MNRTHANAIKHPDMSENALPLFTSLLVLTIFGAVEGETSPGRYRLLRCEDACEAERSSGILCSGEIAVDGTCTPRKLRTVPGSDFVCVAGDDWSWCGHSSSSPGSLGGVAGMSSNGSSSSSTIGGSKADKRRAAARFC